MIQHGCKLLFGTGHDQACTALMARGYALSISERTYLVAHSGDGRRYFVEDTPRAWLLGLIMRHDQNTDWCDFENPVAIPKPALRP